jgi:hypothetical protein
MSAFDPQRASMCSRPAIKQSRRRLGRIKARSSLKDRWLELSPEVRKSTALKRAQEFDGLRED